MRPKTVTKVTAVAVVSKGAADSGSFEAILSAPGEDREGEDVQAAEWQSLPDSIPINVDHNMTTAGLVGSAVPEIQDDGTLKVTGTYASTPLAQTVRTLVTEGHLKSMSVEFFRHTAYADNGDIKSVSRELIGGAFTNYPAQPKAVVLNSKATEGGSSVDLEIDGKRYALTYNVDADGNPVPSELVLDLTEAKTTSDIDADSATAADAAPAEDADDDVVKSLELQAALISIQAMAYTD